MYDSVLDRDLYPIYSDTPENTKKWLKTHPRQDEIVVLLGKSLELMSVEDYLAEVK